MKRRAALSVARARAFCECAAQRACCRLWCLTVPFSAAELAGLRALV